MMDLRDLEKMPETERLAAVLGLVRQVQDDAQAVARLLLRQKTPPPRALQDRWRPVIEEAAEQVVEASTVLATAVAAVRGAKGETFTWSKGAPTAGWLHALVRTAGSLTGLIVRLQAYEIEGRSVDQLNTMRARALVALPPTIRQQLMADIDGDP